MAFRTLTQAPAPEAFAAVCRATKPPRSSRELPAGWAPGVIRPVSWPRAGVSRGGALVERMGPNLCVLSDSPHSSMPVDTAGESLESPHELHIAKSGVLGCGRLPDCPPQLMGHGAPAIDPIRSPQPDPTTCRLIREPHTHSLCGACVRVLNAAGTERGGSHRAAPTTSDRPHALARPDPAPKRVGVAAV